MNIVEKSKNLMFEQTKLNKAPAWELTEIAIEKGSELSKEYAVDERLVLTSLYLAHTVFSPVWKDQTQENHPKLSSEFVKTYLDEWEVNKSDQKIILNSIEAHHDDVPMESKIAEVVRNAEGFKFLTVTGALVLLHNLGARQTPYKEAASKVLEKMEQKKSLLTLDSCIEEAEKNCLEIEMILKK